MSTTMHESLANWSWATTLVHWKHLRGRDTIAEAAAKALTAAKQACLEILMESVEPRWTSNRRDHCGPAGQPLRLARNLTSVRCGGLHLDSSREVHNTMNAAKAHKDSLLPGVPNGAPQDSSRRARAHDFSSGTEETTRERRKLREHSVQPGTGDMSR